MEIDEILDGGMTVAASAIADRRVSPLELTRRALERISRDRTNSFIRTMDETAIRSARIAEREVLRGVWRGPLHGIPIAVKDNVFTRGVETTMGSRAYEGYVPNIDATVVRRLRRHGAVIIGKANTHEFAYGATGDRSAAGPVRNPHDLSKMSGGSSSGSAAAVAGNLVFGAIGTDTGGSARVPAAYCGVVGMKPTYGRVSTTGVFPLARTLDHVGPLTRTVEDNAHMLATIVGYDGADPASVRGRFRVADTRLKETVAGRTIGLPRSFFFDGIDAGVRNVVDAAVNVFQELGVRVRDVEIAGVGDIYHASKIIMRYEAYHALEEVMQAHRALLDDEVRERIESGRDVTEPEYVRAVQARRQAIDAYGSALADVDILLTPTVPVPPILIDQRAAVVGDMSVDVRALLGRMTASTNLNGFPSLTLPCGTLSDGLPVGMQLVGRPFDEGLLYRFGYAFERRQAA